MATEQRAAANAAPIHVRTSARSRTGEESGAGWLLLALLGLAGFVALTLVVGAHVPLFFDPPILAFARSMDGTPLVWQALSESANIPLIVIGLGMVAWLFVTKRRREALIVLLLLAAITIGSEGVKQLLARPRPSGTDPNIPGVVYSYPSGHVLEALTILGIVTVKRWRSAWPHLAKVALAVTVIVWVLLVGFARMALNAHYPSDVLAGLLGGSGSLGLYGLLTRPGREADKGQAAGVGTGARSAASGSFGGPS